MRFYTTLEQDTAIGEWYVHCGMRSDCYTEVGTVEVGKTKATALRKAARALKRESDRLFKEASKL